MHENDKNTSRPIAWAGALFSVALTGWMIATMSSGCTMLHPCGAEDREFCVDDDCVCGERCDIDDPGCRSSEICAAYAFDSTQGVCIDDDHDLGDGITVISDNGTSNGDGDAGLDAGHDAGSDAENGNGTDDAFEQACDDACENDRCKNRCIPHESAIAEVFENGCEEARLDLLECKSDCDSEADNVFEECSSPCADGCPDGAECRGTTCQAKSVLCNAADDCATDDFDCSANGICMWPCNDDDDCLNHEECNVNYCERP